MKEYTERVKYLKSLSAVRERTAHLLNHPSHLQCFNVNIHKLPLAINEILALIKRDYKSPSDIPMHSRWRHFEAKPIAGTPNKGVLENATKRIHLLSKTWIDTEKIDQLEVVRRLLDLFVVSVLLDAGAGDKWKFIVNHEGGTVYNRSEGLGIASLEWFKNGGFSSNKTLPFQCDSKGLLGVTVKNLNLALQVNSDTNPLVGAEGRCLLLQRLGQVLVDFPEYFGHENPRPGNLLDFILNHKDTIKVGDDKLSSPITTLWEVVMEGFSGVWPASRTKLDGVSLGDVWPSTAFQKFAKTEQISKSSLKGEETLIVFHKLSQWLTYSLMEPLSLAGIKFTGTEAMTGLAEYRNGGLFVDLEIIELKDHIKAQFPNGTLPRFEVFDQVVVEWRALTVALLDLVAKEVRGALGLSEDELPLVKVLEAGSWKAGREIAAKLRPETKAPPIEIISDGTVF